MRHSFKTSLELLIEALAVIIIIVGVVLGVEKHYLFFVVTILGLGFFYIYKKKRREKAIREYKEGIRNKWGLERVEKRKHSDIKTLNSLLLEKGMPYFNIDDVTWRDLNMDTVFCKIDHTMSFAGMQYLYFILRKPLFDKYTLKKRNEIINSFKISKEFSQEVQYILSLLKKDKGKDMVTYFRDGIDIETKNLLKYRLLSFLPFLGILFLFINSKIGFLVLFITIPMNALIYNNYVSRADLETERFKYLGSLINCAEEILKLENNDNIDLDQSRLKEILEKTVKIKKNVSKINYNDSFRTEIQLILDYMNMIFLREPIAFYSTVELLNEYKKELLELYLIIGKFDAYISIASYKSGVVSYTEPILNKDSSSFYMKAEEMYHPLLEKPIPYSFELDNRGILITGSNASGKSTFLRTMGVNALFSQTLYMVLAETYNASYFKLLTSIGTVDNIVEGDSYFMVEAKSLKRIIDSLDPEEPVLCILDEIFKGTNTAERISAANQSLNYMAEKNACVIIATHDLELVNLVDKGYDNYHFKETMVNEDIKFDYKLRNGPSTTRNAIAILRSLGYPEEIHENAKIQAKEYLKG